MTDVQRTDLDSGRAVDKVFKDHQTFVNGDANILATQTWLSGLIQAIDLKASVQQAGRGSAKEIKDNLKDSGTELGQKWLNALKGLATATDNKELEKAVDISPSGYAKLPDNEWYQFNLQFVPLCQTYAAEVIKFGRVASEVETLKALNESFRVAMPTPEAARSTMAKITEDLAGLFEELNTRLREKTDALVKAYEEVQPNFVREYQLARRKV